MSENQQAGETAATSAKPDKPAKPAKPEKVTKNGITRPTGKSTGRVFDIADNLSKKAGQPATRKDVIEACKAEGINPATAATQYGRWRKFHGLEGRSTGTANAGSGEPKAASEPENTKASA